MDKLQRYEIDVKIDNTNMHAKESGHFCLSTEVTALEAKIEKLTADRDSVERVLRKEMEKNTRLEAKGIIQHEVIDDLKKKVAQQKLDKCRQMHRAGVADIKNGKLREQLKDVAGVLSLYGNPALWVISKEIWEELK